MKKLSVIALLFLATACQKDNVVPREGSSSQDLPQSKPSDETGLVFNVNKQSLLELVNEIRTKGCNCGSKKMLPVGKVEWNEQLAKASYLHSFDMINQQFFSHTNFSGQTPGDRIKAQGFNWSTYGENIAEGYADEAAVVAGWLKSEGHCKNIMNGYFKYMGAGRQENTWTQVFGSLK